MLRAQNHVCAICKNPEAKKLCLDHCHKTGNIRGILCDDCNNALGRLKDNPITALSAVRYLKNYS